MKLKILLLPDLTVCINEGKLTSLCFSTDAITFPRAPITQVRGVDTLQILQMTETEHREWKAAEWSIISAINEFGRFGWWGENEFGRGGEERGEINFKFLLYRHHGSKVG
jgi:hypothetical protein